MYHLFSNQNIVNKSQNSYIVNQIKDTLNWLIDSLKMSKNLRHGNGVKS